MGFHIVNSAAVQDPKLDPPKPEVLLYEQRTGGLQLIGVEYMKVDGDQQLATDGDRRSSPARKASIRARSSSRPTTACCAATMLRLWLTRT